MKSLLAKFLLIVIVFFGSVTVGKWRGDVSEERLPFPLAAHRIYQDISGELPEYDVFQKALSGYLKLKEEGHFPDKNLLTVIDFRLPSSEKRLWVIDLDKRETLIYSVVSHGRNSGNVFAEKFSNKPESYMSSLGFYSTSEIYQGKHGISLRLDGLQEGLNDKARERAIVIHGADYADESVAATGRLGRSLGCPAVPQKLAPTLIKTIAQASCLFIYYPDPVLESFVSEMPEYMEI